MKIVRYNQKYYTTWNRFLEEAKNSHFFFHRDYLNYHKGRFLDHSLLCFDHKERLIALLPANQQGSTLFSHQGLTYGGFIVQDNMKAKSMLEIFEATKSYLKAEGFTRVIYKVIPYIHHTKPSQEDLYALFLEDATLIQRELGAVIDLRQPIRYANGRKWSLKKASKEEFKIQKSQDFAPFWKLLKSVLKEHHNATPTHSLEEITYLANTFPNHIKLYLLYKEKSLLAGAVTFDNPHITHLQYVANSQEGRNIGALDYLIDHLIQKCYRDKNYFDFGTSNEQNGRILNYGLIDQKERFGARCVVNDRYEWQL